MNFIFLIFLIFVLRTAADEGSADAATISKVERPQTFERNSEDAFRLYTQYAIIASHCTSNPIHHTSQPGPCLMNWDHCVRSLANEPNVASATLQWQDSSSSSIFSPLRVAPMYPALTLGTRMLYKFSTYEMDAWLGSEGYIAVQDQTKELIIGFGGSTVISDWFNDFRFWQSDYEPLANARRNVSANCPLIESGGPMRVHRGMFAMYTKVLPLVVEGLASIWSSNATLRQTYSLTITGHSLGAALASLLALDLRAHQVAPTDSRIHRWRDLLPEDLPIHVYAVAQPRFGNEALMCYLDSLLGSRYFRLVNNHDVVPLLPPASFGYTHSKQTFYWINAAQVQTETTQVHTCHPVKNTVQDSGDPSRAEKQCHFDSFWPRGHVLYFYNIDIIKRQCRIF